MRLELSSLSAEDLERQRSYAARAEAARLSGAAASLEDFWRSLEMRAQVRPLDQASIDRAAQLTQKTNQFNLTLNRRTREEIERVAGEDGSVCVTLELEDRFARHGLIGLGLLRRSEDDAETATIDTLLLSCRVIGRTAEIHLISHLGRRALELGFQRLRGIYVPGPRNSLVADLYPRLGFEPADGEHCWEYDLAANGPDCERLHPGRAMNRDETFERAFAEVLEDIFGWGVELSDDDGPSAVEGWDSLAQIRLVHELESRFDVRLPDAALLEQQTVGSLKSMVLAHGS